MFCGSEGDRIEGFAREFVKARIVRMPFRRKSTDLFEFEVIVAWEEIEEKGILFHERQREHHV